MVPSAHTPEVQRIFIAWNSSPLTSCTCPRRAIVRTLESPQYAHLEALGQSLSGKLELVQADLVQGGRLFDEAVKGATYV